MKKSLTVLLTVFLLLARSGLALATAASASTATSTSGSASTATQSLDFDVVDPNFISSDRVVLQRDQIAQSQAKDLVQLLGQHSPIISGGTSLQPNTLYLRGGDSSHILVLVDGFPLYDPTSVQRGINLAYLNLKNIFKIEIIKGSQSVLYGGRAMAGVIKIETLLGHEQTAKNAPSNTQIYVRGHERLQDVSLGHSQSLSKLWTMSVSSGVSLQKTTSPVKDSGRTYPEQTNHFELSSSYRPEPGTTIFLKARYLDDFGQMATTAKNYLAQDTEGFHSRWQTWMWGAGLRYGENLTWTLAHQKTRRTLYQSAANTGTVDNDQIYQGQILNSTLNSKIYSTAFMQIYTGLAFNLDQMDSTVSQVTKPTVRQQAEGVYIKLDQKWSDDFLFEVGARSEMEKLVSVAGIYQLGLTWRKILKIEHSTGFKTPSLSQLYGSYGNFNLQPEHIQTTALTVLKNEDSYQFSLTGFDSKYEQMIVSQGKPPQYQNISAARVQGIELAGHVYSYAHNISASVLAVYQEPKDLQLQNWLVRRPLQMTTYRLKKNWGDNFDFALEHQFVGERVDKSGASSYASLHSYRLWNAVFNFKLDSEFQGFIRADNLFAEEYQTAYGFYILKEQSLRVFLFKYKI